MAYGDDLTTDPNLRTPIVDNWGGAGAPPTAPPSTMAGTVGDIGAAAATPPPLGPVLEKHRWALTQPPGNYQQVPTFGQAQQGVETGVPGAGRGMTKLGKVLTILQAAGMGAMAGSTQPTFGTGALAANQFGNQQIATQQEQQQRALALQQGQLGLEQARENLAYTPLYRAMQLEQMRQMQAYRQSQELLNKEHANRYKQLTERPDTIKLKDGSVLQHDPNNPNADENGYVEVHPPMAMKPEKTTPEQETFDYYTRPVAQGGLGKSPAQAFAAMHPHEWQQQPGGGGQGALEPPVTQNLTQRIDALPVEQAVKDTFRKLPVHTQEALLGLASGDILLSGWSSRGMYKRSTGLNQEQAMGWARAISGGQFNAQMFKNREQLYSRYMNGDSKEGGQINAFNNFFAHAGDAEKVIAEWDRQRAQSGVPWINLSINEIRRNLKGDPLLAQLDAALAPVKKEYNDFLNAHRAEHTHDIEEINKILNDTETPAQLRNVLKQLGRTAVDRLDSLNETYRQGTGTDFPNLIHPKIKSDPGVIDLGFGNDLARYRSGGTMPGVMAPPGAAAASPQAQAPPPTPTTHTWSATQWSNAHPGQDVKAAIAEARRQGYNVLP